MENESIEIDLLKLFFYYVKRIWIIALCAVIGFAAMYLYTAKMLPDTYTAAGTMYVYNGNPNAVNYQYTNSYDLDSAVQLIDTYMVVIKSNKVLDAITEKLAPQYPDITPDFIAGSLSAGNVSETSVLQIRCTTGDPQLSTDIANAVLDVAPEEIIRVVNAGSCEVIDYASVPLLPDHRNPLRRGMIGALAGILLACGVLFVLFLLDRRVSDEAELTESYTLPVLASIQREKSDDKKGEKAQASFLLTNRSPMEKVEGYAKLRMNMLYTLVDKEHHSVVITSSISGEGKTTISANLAVSCAMGGKNVLLIDGDLRRACVRDIFLYDSKCPGISEVLIGNISWRQAILSTQYENLHILPAGQFPPNPAELLGSRHMQDLLAELEQAYDLVILDMPPVNVVADPLAVSSIVAGCLFVVRQNYTDHRDLRRSLIEAEMTGMNVLGFVFYGEEHAGGGHYGYYSKRYYRKYYKNYYSKYDNRSKNAGQQDVPVPASTGVNQAVNPVSHNKNGDTQNS